MFRNWASHVWIGLGIAFLALLGTVVGDYLQWKQLQAANSVTLSDAPRSRVVDKPATGAAASPPIRKDATLGAFPFILTSVSSLVLFILLLLITQWHAKAAQVSSSFHERLDVLETKTKLGVTAPSALDECRDSFFARILAVEEAHRQEISTERTRIDSLGDYSRSILAAHQRLEINFTALRKSAANAAFSFTGFMCIQADLTNLLFRAMLIRQQLEWIVERFPGCAAAQAPFSQAWWSGYLFSTEHEAHALAVEWALNVKWQISECVGFAAKLGIGQSTVLGPLFNLGWNSNAGLDACRRDLYSHVAILIGMRQDYATNFSAPLVVSTKDTIS